MDNVRKICNAIDPNRVPETSALLQPQGKHLNYVNLCPSSKNQNDTANKNQYDNDDAISKYRNFLSWLFQTFEQSEDEFRAKCSELLGLEPENRLLVTGCGLGQDLGHFVETVGPNGEVHAQDLSISFVKNAADYDQNKSVCFTISNALDLPYKDDYFDAVFHFGGINLFGDVAGAIAEMDRVCKTGGNVLFGDESVASHLREHDYGKMFIKNNALWACQPPLNHLPVFCDNISLRYVLGNCFYMIKFRKNRKLPDHNIDVIHKGTRGGSVRTRYYGQIDGVDPSCVNKLKRVAKKNRKSIVATLEEAIKKL